MIYSTNWSVCRWLNVGFMCASVWGLTTNPWLTGIAFTGVHMFYDLIDTWENVVGKSEDEEAKKDG